MLYHTPAELGVIRCDVAEVTLLSWDPFAMRPECQHPGCTGVVIDGDSQAAPISGGLGQPRWDLP